MQVEKVLERFEEVKGIAKKDTSFVTKEMFALPAKGKHGYVWIQHWVDMMLLHIPSAKPEVTKEEIETVLKLDPAAGDLNRKMDFEDYLELTSRLLRSDLFTVAPAPAAAAVHDEGEVKAVEAEESLSSFQQPIAEEGSLLFKWIQWLQQE